MGHLASALFFCGLLVALGMILEATVRAHWPLIRAALLGRDFRALPAPRPRARRSAAA